MLKRDVLKLFRGSIVWLGFIACSSIYGFNPQNVVVL